MRFLRRLTALFMLTLLSAPFPAGATGIPGVDAGDLLTGDTRLACEAILCLAGTKPPSECDPALSRFFGIKMRKLSDTLDARLDFLNLCPDSNNSSEMSSLVKAMAQGAGRCDAKTLNQLLQYQMGTGGDAGYGGSAISNQMPPYCAAYITHAYTNLKDDLPRYVGTPQADGFWVESKDYTSALARYEREQAAKKAARENYGSGGN